MTSSSTFLLRTGTPRQKRCGSRISSRAEKLFEWPLCGVAERKSRCSNRPGQVADGPGDLGVDGVFGSARRGGVVGLVEDEQGAGPEVAKPVAQRRGVGFVDEQAVRDQEPGVGGPGVDAVASFPPDIGDVILVEDLEDHAEAGFELILPLQEHRRRAGDDDVLDLLAQEQFAGDEAGLDRLAEADVIGDEEIDPGQTQGLLQRLQLVGVDPDAGPEGGLEEVRIGRGDAVPLQRVQVGGEELGRVEAPAGDLLPGFGVDRLGIDFLLPEHLQRLALGVVVEAGHPHEGRVVTGAGSDDIFDQILPLAYTDDLAGLGCFWHDSHQQLRKARCGAFVVVRHCSRSQERFPSLTGCEPHCNHGDGATKARAQAKCQQGRVSLRSATRNPRLGTDRLPVWPDRGGRRPGPPGPLRRRGRDQGRRSCVVSGPARAGGGSGTGRDPPALPGPTSAASGSGRERPGIIARPPPARPGGFGGVDERLPSPVRRERPTWWLHRAGRSRPRGRLASIAVPPNAQRCVRESPSHGLSSRPRAASNVSWSFRRRSCLGGRSVK